MTRRQVRVAVAAETIPYRGAGLGHFLVNGIGALAKARPEWKFEVVCTSSFGELRSMNLRNVRAHTWDNGVSERLLRALALIAGKPLGKGKIVSYSLLRRLRRVGIRYGRLEAIWRDLSAADVAWLPHFSLGPERLSPPPLCSSDAPRQVLTIHDIHPAFYPEDWGPLALARFWNTFVPYALSCHRVITHTEYQKSMILEHLGLPSHKVAVIPAPPLIDLDELAAPAGQSVRLDQATRNISSRPFVLYPGSGTHTHKNHTRLIVAWLQLRLRLGAKLPLLVCTGKGHRWPYLCELIKTLDLVDDVVFTDTIPTATLASLLRACLFVVVPSLYEGGGSGPVGDACLLGKPAVCSRIPPIVEQLQAYGDLQVLYFDPQSVGDIARAVIECLGHLEHWQQVASVNATRLRAEVRALWGRWAEFYAGQFEALLEV